ncbi:MAG: SDH family Clp fold serine proteinase [Gaiellaceae bacterium]
MDPLSLLWLFFILASLQPAAQRYVLEARRRANLDALAKKRGSTIITLIYRQESMSLFGFPLVRYIDIDDAESILRAIHKTPRGQPIEFILHTPGGLVIAARQIAAALADHDGKVTAVVPHYVWVPKTQFGRSRGCLVFVDQPSEDVSASDAVEVGDWSRLGFGFAGVWRSLVEGAVGAMCVVVPDLGGEDSFEVAAVED